jgi:2-hydroxy-4-carboxymuconate semialdehyde hemiacetal dehydrogenase
MNQVGIALAGAGAFGLRHLQALGRIAQADVVVIVESDTGKATQLRVEYGVGKVRDTLAEVLAMAEVDAVILCAPTPVHGEQALSCLTAGKHVLVEIPLGDSLAAARAVVDAQCKTGLVAMCGTYAPVQFQSQMDPRPHRRGNVHPPAAGKGRFRTGLNPRIRPEEPPP